MFRFLAFATVGFRFVLLFRFKQLNASRSTFVVFVKSFGEGEGRLPWLLDFDAWSDFL
jgi:hypothetical protein